MVAATHDIHSHAEAPAPTLRAVLFEVGDALCAIEITDVLEVTRVGKVTRVPHAAPRVVGATNVRGRVIPLIDFRELCEIATEDRADAARLIIVRDGENAVGLIVDRVLQTTTLEPGDDADCASHCARQFSLMGRMWFDERIVVVVDTAKLLAGAEHAAEKES